MKFALVLLILGWRLRWLAWRNEGFRAQLENRNVVMQWRTFPGKPARWFQFTPGKVVAKGGLHEAPTVTLNFKDGDYAFTTLKKAGKNQMAFMEGMQAGDIKIEGDPGQLMWFMTLMKFIMPGGKK
ncbi:hypothetical protein Y5S_02959 [Alcanivorax nanhaiticus]|uniref:SCP2 domain-containing protein n=1 Tax=Alcanivorax nanhaiticus TaxID=1177154 RepID=A0A095SGS7_9GAMM|nr:hypothetical protein [Alcanivorax nanhaiticus]KGD63752.1 hypothetical protein Y5S_02959 [Alcanivorax nanhaiticus]